MLRINQIKLRLGEPVAQIPAKIGSALKIKDFRPASWRIVRESVDARHKPDIMFVYTIDFEVENEEKLLKKASKIKGIQLSAVENRSYELPHVPDYLKENIENGTTERPVIVGFGPCGMFAALILARLGLRPVVIERGKKVEERAADVEHFWKTGELDTESNVQFGEGGAGTFSDGKLTTGIKDPRIGKVNDEFISAGADPAIAYRQMPHIGTDVLRDVVRNIREKIQKLGGEIRFGSCVSGIEFSDCGSSRSCGSEDDNRKSISAVIVNGSERIPCSHAVFALGNSARDTFRLLKKEGIEMVSKPFSVGVRIEHPQVMIDESQYGIDVNDTEGRLGAAAYKLSHHCANGRGVYTFCMCPGGYVVGAASQENRVATNGMSYYARDGANANSALLVGVDSSDFDDPEDPVSGIDFQEKLEELAFSLGGGGYFAPAQRVGDFMKGQAGGPGKTVKPTYLPGVTWTDMNGCLPESVTDAMKEALPELGRRLKGFDMDDAVITGVETRSSCPVRILRDKSYQSVSVKGIYPAGEGAGYAGGIMSAAVDGIKVAEALIENMLSCK